MSISLFHQLLNSVHKLVHNLVFTVSYITHDAVMNVAGQQIFVKRVECRCRDGRLRQYIRAVGAFFKHLFESSYLSLNTAEPVDKPRIFFL